MVVGVRPAGGDFDPGIPVGPVHCSQMRSLDRDLDVSTSGKFAWFVVLQ